MLPLWREVLRRQKRHNGPGIPIQHRIDIVQPTIAGFSPAVW